MLSRGLFFAGWYVMAGVYGALAYAFAAANDVGGELIFYGLTLTILLWIVAAVAARS
jgi:hypothetical protein